MVKEEAEGATALPSSSLEAVVVEQRAAGDVEQGKASSIATVDEQRSKDCGEGGRSDYIRRAVIGLVITTELCNNLLIAVIMPFYPDFAREHLGVSPSTLGVIFSLFPIMVLIASPFAGAAATRWGRARVMMLGIALVFGGTLGFGLARDAGVCMTMRALQGLGVAFINVAGMALILQVSQNVQRDVGLMLVAAGIGFLVGPPLGGIIFWSLGFFPVFAIMAAAFLAVGLALLCFMGLIPSCPPRVAAGSEGEGQLRSWRRMLGSVPVLATALANTLGFMSLSFLYPIAEPHLERVLGVDPVGVGLLFMVPSIAYVVASLAAEAATDRLGCRNTVSLGLGLLAVSVLLLGPAPFLLPLGWTMVGAWAGQLSALVIFGCGLSFVQVATVPLQRSYLAKFGPQRDDFISAIDSSSYSLGEALGPLFAGITMDALPKLGEIACKPASYQPDCRDGVSWTALVFACVLLATLACFRAATPTVTPSGDDDDDERVEQQQMEKEEEEAVTTG